MATVQYKRDLKQMEQRRRKGMRMLARAVTQAEVARTLQVSRQTVSNWARAAAAHAQAWRRKPLGRPGGLTDAERARLSKLLVDGAVACGFPTELWTLARVGALIEVQFGRVYSTTQVWRVLLHTYNKSDTAHQFYVGGAAASANASLFSEWTLQPYADAVYTTFLPLSDGTNTTLHRRERPKILFNATTGAPAVLYNGVCPGSGNTNGCFTVAQAILPPASA